MDNGNKNIAKVLTTDEIRNLAGDWSLAGDVGLLAHLEQLSEKIFDRTKETQKHFDELIDEYEDAFAKVGNITNQFLALQNCQFVENRVYDEETPSEETPAVKVQDEAEQERLLLLNYKEAVEIGVKLLDTHFQEVQLPPNSDSEEEDEISDGNSIIWKPKNPYAGKKFPLLIGSAEWWADDYVGLRANEESLETEKIVSESESEFESLRSTDKKVKSSSSSSASSVENLQPFTSKPFLESSSEDLFGVDKHNKVTNSADFSSKSSSFLKEPVSFLPDLESIENGPEMDPLTENEPQKTDLVQEETKKPAKVDNAFTRELMAKLSSVTTKTGNVGEEEGQKALSKVVKPEKSLFDETDDASDLFSSKIDSIPVGEKELFFDVENDDELFRGSKDLFSGSSLFENDALKPETESVLKKTIGHEVKETKKPEEPRNEVDPPKKHFVEDLFDDLDDDETLFAKKPAEKNIFASPISQTKKSAPVAPELGWENDEGLFDSINNVVDTDFPSSPLSSQKINAETKIAEESKRKEANGAFESDDTFESENDLFGFASTDKVAEADDDDLFSVGFNPSPKVNDDSSLFGDKPKLADSISSSRSSLFDDANVSKTLLASVFQKDAAKTEGLFSSNKNQVKSTKTSLFDDEDDDGDDLFGEKSLFKSKKEETKVVTESPKIKESKTDSAKKNLFHDVDDGELFGKSEKKATPPSSLGLPGKSVGKLSIPDNLKSRFESVAKHITPGAVKPLFKEEDNTAKEKDTIPKAKDTTPKEKETIRKVEDGAPKEEKFEPRNLLKCPNKDRAKIPGRRRPQSRRARQEAIRTSGIWEQPSSPPISSSNPLSPSTDEEDFFKVPELDINFEKEDQSIFKSDLFESKPEDGLLFDGAPVLSPKVPESKTANLFDDDDDDDENLFNAPLKQSRKAEVKKPLFDGDLDEDDDLFGCQSHVTPTKAPNTTKPKESRETKEKGNSSFVDPLGLNSNDD